MQDGGRGLSTIFPPLEVGACPRGRSRCKTISLLLIQQAGYSRREAWKHVLDERFSLTLVGQSGAIIARGCVASHETARRQQELYLIALRHGELGMATFIAPLSLGACVEKDIKECISVITIMD
jgi:hypothetical protein